MEIKATLNKPYTEKERCDFIVAQNHNNGYEIRETDEALEAWGYDDAEKLEQKKAQVRGVREQYFKIYVDYYQEKPLLWAELTEQNQQYIADYRIYLKDYPESSPDWYERNPMTYDEWFTAQQFAPNEVPDEAPVEEDPQDESPVEEDVQQELF